MLGSRSCWRAWIDLLAGMLFFFSLEGAVVFFWFHVIYCFLVFSCFFVISPPRYLLY